MSDVVSNHNVLSVNSNNVEQLVPQSDKQDIKRKREGDQTEVETVENLGRECLEASSSTHKRVKYEDDVLRTSMGCYFNVSLQRSTITKVYVWDLDETLIIFACLLMKDTSRFKSKRIVSSENKSVEKVEPNATNSVKVVSSINSEGLSSGLHSLEGIKSKGKNSDIFKSDSLGICSTLLIQKETSSEQASTAGPVDANVGTIVSPVPLAYKSFTGSRCEGKEENASHTSTDEDVGYALGQTIENLVFYLADEYMFFEELEAVDPVTLTSLLLADDGRDLTDHDFTSDGLVECLCQDYPPSTAVIRTMQTCLAHRLRRITEIYNSLREAELASDTKLFQARMRELLPTGTLTTWMRTYDSIDEFSEGWMSVAIMVLELISKRNDTVNVMVTSSQLIPAISKTILFNLSKYFAFDCIYTSRSQGKEACFQDIKERFGGTSVYHAIGDSCEEIDAGKKMGWHTHVIREVGHMKIFLSELMRSEAAESS
eukprot:CFRG6957T1